MCEDLFGCDHAPETAVVGGNEIVAWLCRCGSKTHVVGSCQCVHCTPQGEDTRTPEER